MICVETVPRFAVKCRIEVFFNASANSTGSCGGASLAAVPSEAKADKIMRSRFSSVAKGALEKERSPAAMSD